MRWVMQKSGFNIGIEEAASDFTARRKELPKKEG